jgi:hydroxyacylglutathione hydrolase
MELLCFESRLWQTASVLVVAEREALAFDPSISVDDVAAIAVRAASLGARVGHVVVTHADWDHICGIGAFPDAVAAMGPLTAARVGEAGFTEDVQRHATAAGLTVPSPPRVDRVLEPGRAHRLGAFTLETMAAPGHTSDGVSYRLREPDVLVVGDYLSAVEFPFAASTAAYRATLAAFVELLRHDPPELVVPGHGPALTAPQALEIAEQDLGYLHRLRDSVARALGDGGRDDALAAGLAVEPPRGAPDDLATERGVNVEVQLAELLPGE